MAEGKDGFELDGDFYEWHVTDTGKDLMLIDQFAQMPVADFFETVEDSVDRSRAPIVLALIATSIRHKHPSWSYERIARLVMSTPLSSYTFVGDEEEVAVDPPARAAEAAASATGARRSGG